MTGTIRLNHTKYLTTRYLILLYHSYRSPPASRKSQVSATPITNNLSKNLSPTSRARSRSRSPAVQRNSALASLGSPNQVTNIKISIYSSKSYIFSQNVDKVNLLPSPRLSKRSVSPTLKQILNIRKKQVSIEIPVKFSENSSHFLKKSLNSKIEDSFELPNVYVNTENKYENSSDNGSEISDEGYRSLVQVKKCLNHQASEEDLKTNRKVNKNV